MKLTLATVLFLVTLCLSQRVFCSAPELSNIAWSTPEQSDEYITVKGTVSISGVQRSIRWTLNTGSSVYDLYLDGESATGAKLFVMDSGDPVDPMVMVFRERQESNVEGNLFPLFKARGSDLFLPLRKPPRLPATVWSPYPADSLQLLRTEPMVGGGSRKFWDAQTEQGAFSFVMEEKDGVYRFYYLEYYTVEIPPRRQKMYVWRPQGSQEYVIMQYISPQLGSWDIPCLRYIVGIPAGNLDKKSGAR